MPVPPTLGKQDAPIIPSLCNQMLLQPPTLPEAPWHLRQGKGRGGGCPPLREAMGPLKPLSQQHGMPEVMALLCCFRG